MWISKDRMQRIEERLQALERKVESNRNEDVEAHTFTVFKELPGRVGYFLYPNYLPKQEISVKSVISRILSNLGMELVYVDGTPTEVRLEKKKK